MKRKLIEVSQEYLIVCDNPKCDYVIENEDRIYPNPEAIKYLNMPCPKCGDNLLTENDYKTGMQTMKVVNWLNKWFSWLMIFVSKRAEMKTTYVHFHNGVNITDKK